MRSVSTVTSLFLYLTVSGLHARIKKKGGVLLVMDLDSTNGTFIDEKRLRPGVVATVSPGSCITFGMLSQIYSIWASTNIYFTAFGMISN